MLKVHGIIYFQIFLVNPDIPSTEFNKILFKNIKDTIELKDSQQFYNLIRIILLDPNTVSGITPGEIENRDDYFYNIKDSV